MHTENDDLSVSQQFRNAWFDLRDRLDNGVDSLRDMRFNGSSPSSAENFARLTRKANGMEAAATIWRDVHAEMRGDEAGSWRTFTDRIVGLHRATTQGTDFQEGLRVALSYQRGYGADVDAPRIHVLLPESDEKR